MALVGPTSVPAGASSITVTISPPQSGYQPMVSPNWNTTVASVIINTTEFTVSFGTPAPLDGSGIIYWQAVTATTPPSGQLSTLQQYLNRLNQLLHDPNNQYWSQADKIDFINEGMQQRDLDTGQNRLVFPFTLTVGQDTYSFADLVAQNPPPPTGPTLVPFGATSITIPLSPSIASYQVLLNPNWNTTAYAVNLTPTSFNVVFGTPAPATAVLYWQLVGFNVRSDATHVFDVVSINLLYNNLRYVMGTMSYSELNATVRQYNPPLTWAPVRYCRYGPNTLIFGPAPSIAYATEWDCSVYGTPLVNLTDFDMLPYPYTKPVPYYAAYVAKLNERQYDEAETFMTRYTAELQSAVNARVGTVPSMYANDVSIVRLS